MAGISILVPVTTKDPLVTWRTLFTKYIKYGKIMYVADDQPADLYDMANMIQKTVGARNIFHVPLWIAKLAARIGDGCKAVGWHSVPLSYREYAGRN